MEKRSLREINDENSIVAHPDWLCAGWYFNFPFQFLSNPRLNKALCDG
jgi:hypothetical protein